MKAQNILETIGQTPHVRMNRLFPGNEVWIKAERANPAGSIKDRIALAMVEDAERSGALQPGGTIIEPTSGNTGIGLAMVAAVKGYKLVLVMPDSMSIERRRLMLAYGASFDLTPREKGMKGSIARAQELVAQTPGAWMPQQFENPANIAVHVRTTAEEIWNDTDGAVDVLKAIRQRFPWLRHVFADGGYAGDKLRDALRRIGKWTVEIIKRSDTAKGFEVLPRRWVVERTLAWLSRNRRLAKDFEETIASATAWLFIASIQLYARRIARP